VPASSGRRSRLRTQWIIRTRPADDTAWWEHRPWAREQALRGVRCSLVRKESAKTEMRTAHRGYRLRRSPFRRQGIPGPLPRVAVTARAPVRERVLTRWRPHAQPLITRMTPAVDGRVALFPAPFRKRGKGPSLRVDGRLTISSYELAECQRDSITASVTEVVPRSGEPEAASLMSPLSNARWTAASIRVPISGSPT
jgi:hypothetical protein